MKLRTMRRNVSLRTMRKNVFRSFSGSTLFRNTKFALSGLLLFSTISMPISCAHSNNRKMDTAIQNTIPKPDKKLPTFKNFFMFPDEKNNFKFEIDVEGREYIINLEKYVKGEKAVSVSANNTGQIIYLSKDKLRVFQFVPKNNGKYLLKPLFNATINSLTEYQLRDSTIVAADIFFPDGISYERAVILTINNAGLLVVAKYSPDFYYDYECEENQERYASNKDVDDSGKYDRLILNINKVGHWPDADNIKRIFTKILSRNVFLVMLIGKKDAHIHRYYYFTRKCNDYRYHSGTETLNTHVISVGHAGRPDRADNITSIYYADKPSEGGIGALVKYKRADGKEGGSAFLLLSHEVQKRVRKDNKNLTGIGVNPKQ